MRNLGLVLFAAVSLIVHVTAAAVFISPPDPVQEERGAGSASLEIGNLFDSAANEAVPPTQMKPVTEQPDTIEPVVANRAIETKSFVQNDVVPTEVKPTAAIEAEAPEAPPMELAALEDLTVNEALPEPDILKPRTIEAVSPDDEAAKEPRPVEVRETKEVKEVREAPVIKEAKAVTTVEARPVEAAVVKRIEEAPAIMPKVAPRPKVVTAKAPPKTPVKATSKATANAPSKASRKGGTVADAKGKKGELGGSGGKAARAAGQKLVSNYQGKVRTKLRRRLVYPSGAKRRKETGIATVRFVIARNGSASGIQLIKSSGKSRLDNAALATVRKASPFPPHPSGYSGGPITVTVPIAFQL